MGRTCGEPDEIELTAMGVKLNGSRCRLVANATAFAPDTYMNMKPCNGSDEQQQGWKLQPSAAGAGAGAAAAAAVATTRVVGRRGSGLGCVTALHPMYEAALLPCNASDTRQDFVYNAKTMALQTAITYAAPNPLTIANHDCHRNRRRWRVLGCHFSHHHSRPATAAAVAASSAHYHPYRHTCCPVRSPARTRLVGGAGTLSSRRRAS